MEEKGWTITFIRWDDGEKRVAGRFKTTKEKDDFLKRIHEANSGWTSEELESIGIINDYYFTV